MNVQTPIVFQCGSRSDHAVDARYTEFIRSAIFHTSPAVPTERQRKDRSLAVLFVPFIRVFTQIFSRSPHM